MGGPGQLCDSSLLETIVTATSPAQRSALSTETVALSSFPPLTYSTVLCIPHSFPPHIVPPILASPIVDYEQARRVSKSIDDGIKVSLLITCAVRLILLRSAKRISPRKDRRKVRMSTVCHFPVPPFIVSDLPLPPSPDWFSPVLLLGQAESGKSTLKKLFQLYHGSPTLDRERPSWRPIVYFSVIQAVRTILDELDRDFTSPANLEDGGHIDPGWSTQISHIRHKLLPLVTIEDSLASELGGRSGAFTRAGWQYVVTPTRSWPVADMRDGTNSSQGVVATTASRLLVDLQSDIVKLWQHPAVKTFLRIRRLRLEESAALFAYPFVFIGSCTHISPLAS